MAFCSKCGAQLETDAKACPSCGATVGETSEKKENSSDFGARAEEAFNKFNDTKDDTSAFDPADIESNKAMGILSYLSWLVLIPLIAAPKSPFARFHANQGLILAIIEIAFGIVLGALSLIPVIGIVFNIILSLLWLVFLLFTILGIVNAANGKAKELPVIGKIRLIK